MAIGSAEWDTESSHSQKGKLRMIKHGHHVDGWLLYVCKALHPLEDFSTVKFCVDCKSPLDNRWDYKLKFPVCVQITMYTHAKRSHTHIKDRALHVRVQWIMEHGSTEITLYADRCKQVGFGYILNVLVVFNFISGNSSCVLYFYDIIYAIQHI